jgi:hypothetical protein
MKWGLLLTSVILVTGISCSKSNGTHTSQNDSSSDTSANIVTYQIEGMNPQISFAAPNIYVQFADSILNPGNQVASFTLSPDATASVQGVSQTSGLSMNNFEDAITYTVTSAGGTTRNWEVIGTNNNYTVNWGLGQWLQKAVSNNRDYNWYIDQGTTDSCGAINCGPTSVTMAIKWSDSTTEVTPTKARLSLGTGCGTWSTFDVAHYLNQNVIPYSWIPLPDNATQMRDSFKSRLDSGRIMIIELMMSAVRETVSGPNSRVDKFYGGSFDHFIILKGYRQVDEELFFEVYDPWNLGETYKDGSPVGENRYYRYEDIFNACGDFSGGGTGIQEIVVRQK